MGALFSPQKRARPSLKAIPGILMPAIILGGIFSGYFTLRGGGLAVVYALLVSTFVHRDMSPQKALYDDARLGEDQRRHYDYHRVQRSVRLGAGQLEDSEAISSAVLSVSTNKYVSSSS